MPAVRPGNAGGEVESREVVFADLSEGSVPGSV
jgi:hypothetical protein